MHMHMHMHMHTRTCTRAYACACIGAAAGGEGRARGGVARHGAERVAAAGGGGGRRKACAGAGGGGDARGGGARSGGTPRTRWVARGRDGGVRSSCTAPCSQGAGPTRGGGGEGVEVGGDCGGEGGGVCHPVGCDQGERARAMQGAGGTLLVHCMSTACALHVHCVCTVCAFMPTPHALCLHRSFG